MTTRGKWASIRRASEECDCQQCGYPMGAGDDVYVRQETCYCGEACADEAASHEDGLMPRHEEEGGGE